MSSAPPPSAAAADEELADLLLAFLEVATHGILHARRVYPAAAFERRRQYGVSVWMSRHPRLNARVHAALQHARAALLRGAVEAVVLLLVDAASGTPREQFVFATSLRGTPQLPAQASAAAPALRVAEVPATYADLETMFASALLRLAVMEGDLPPLPSAADGGGGAATAFTLMLRTHECLDGPNSRGALDALWARGGGSSSSSSAAASAPASAWHPGVLGSAAGAVASAAAASAGGAEVWARVDRGDAEAVLAAAAGAGGAPPPVSRAIKSVRAGALAVDISVEFAAP